MIIELSATQRENSRISICGNIFRDSLRTFLGVFSAKDGVCASFQAKLYKIIFAIKYDNEKN